MSLWPNTCSLAVHLGHELGIEGTQLIALATCFASRGGEVTPAKMSDWLLPYYRLSKSNTTPRDFEKL